MARNIPVISWTMRQSPSSDPKFHQTESFLGVGRSTKDPLTIRNKGCLFRIGPVIYINGVLLVFIVITFRKNFGFL